MPKLHRTDWREEGGRMVPFKNEDLFVWAAVNNATGEVEMSDLESYDDEPRGLVAGWEWVKFRMIRVENEDNGRKL